MDVKIRPNLVEGLFLTIPKRTRAASDFIMGVVLPRSAGMASMCREFGLDLFAKWVWHGGSRR